MAINKSSIRTIEILELFAARGELTLTEISVALDIPPASTSDIIRALLAKQMIEEANRRAKTYKIGVKAFAIGNAYLSNVNIVEIAGPVMTKLSEQVKNTVFLATLADSNIVYLHKVEPRDTLVSTCQIGSVTGLTVTALGKAILAHNAQLQERVFSKPLMKLTERSITDHAALKDQLATVKANGYSIDRFENDERISCLGFPVFDQWGVVKHSISISGGDFDLRDVDEEIKLGMAGAKKISAGLGFVER